VAPHTIDVENKEAAEIKDRFLTIWVRSRIHVDAHERFLDYINFSKKEMKKKQHKKRHENKVT